MLGTGGAKEAPASGLETFLETARKDGSTVIVVTPGDNTHASASDEASALRTAQFLKVRARIREIVLSVPTLVPNIEGTLRQASPESGFLDCSRDWYRADRLLGRMVRHHAPPKAGREYFSYMYDLNPETTTDKVKYLLFRVVIALVYAGVVS